MTFKGPQSDVEFQIAHDQEGYEYTCYDCNLVTRNKAEAMFGDGHCRVANTIEAILHVKKHQADGDLIPNDLIAHFQNKITRISTFHQSAKEPIRRNQNAREKAFFDQWLYEQESSLLTNLFQGSGLGDLVSHREATIAATLIQWLGTNVGFCFLESALKRCGYKIVKGE